jgi:hypothetical protein
VKATSRPVIKLRGDLVHTDLLQANLRVLLTQHLLIRFKHRYVDREVLQRSSQEVAQFREAREAV